MRTQAVRTVAGIAYGHKVNVFFDKLVRMRYAVGCRCIHNRAAVYHVRHQRLYHAIGVPHSRNRKPVPASRVIERLMLLDAVISHSDLEWLATARDKVTYFSSKASSDISRCPQQTVAGMRRYFPDHVPIGVSPTGQVVFVFLATSSRTDHLMAFLQRHAELFRALQSWAIWLVLPPYVAPMKASIEAVVDDELAKAHSATIGRVEFEVLPLSYRHLSPLTSRVCPRVKGLRRGNTGGNAPQHALNPHASNATPMMGGTVRKTGATW